MLVGLLIEVGLILAGGGLVSVQVEVGTGSNAPQLAPAEGEEELKVGSCLRVEAKLLGIVVTESEVFFLQKQGKLTVVHTIVIKQIH